MGVVYLWLAVHHVKGNASIIVWIEFDEISLHGFAIIILPHAHCLCCVVCQLHYVCHCEGLCLEGVP